MNITWPKTDYMKNLIDGLQIAHTYKGEVSASQDTILVYIPSIKPEDARKLDELGWHQDFDNPEYFIKYA